MKHLPSPPLRPRPLFLVLPLFLLTSWLATACADAPPTEMPSETPTEAASGTDAAAEDPAAGDAERLRVAVFNVWELSAQKVETVDEDGRGAHPQLRHAAEIIQRIRPDVLLVNEIDVLEGKDVSGLFQELYLEVPQEIGLQAVSYPHRVVRAVNTGRPSGLDLDNDGETGGPDDAWGYGRYPGQYGMALYSRLPVDEDAVRTFRLFRWKDLPGHLMPDGREGRPAWYSEEEAEVLRLSSKTHMDVPVELPGGERLHFLASHPTPTVFDGDEDRNGRRNFDEIRLWKEYLGGESVEWLVDDQGRAGGLPAGESFVILGDLNADPYRGDDVYGGANGRTAISQLLDHPRVQDPLPRGEGEPTVSPERLAERGPYPGPEGVRTSSYGRIDYVLPSADLEVLDSGVFLPAEDDPLRDLVEGEDRASDHFLVWVDLAP